jgi:hypothetical protein
MKIGNEPDRWMVRTNWDITDMKENHKWRGKIVQRMDVHDFIVIVREERDRCAQFPGTTRTT